MDIKAHLLEREREKKEQENKYKSSILCYDWKIRIMMIKIKTCLLEFDIIQINIYHSKCTHNK